MSFENVMYSTVLMKHLLVYIGAASLGICFYLILSMNVLIRRF